MKLLHPMKLWRRPLKLRTPREAGQGRAASRRELRLRWSQNGIRSGIKLAGFCIALAVVVLLATAAIDAAFAANAAPRVTGILENVAAATGVAQTTASPPPAAQASSPAQARKELLLTLDAPQTAIHWTLDSSLHTVHGTFTLKRGTVRFDPVTGAASGEIVVDATSGKSGNDSRDKKMHQDVLESAKYSEVIFRPDRVDSPSGPVSSQGSWSVNIHGTFILHGAEHEMSIPAQGEFTAGHWKGTAKFSVPFIAWGLKNPSNFLLKVNPAVDLELDMVGTLQPLSAAK